MSAPTPILITGGTGFLGRYLVREFLEAGHPVGVLCRAGSPREVLQGLPVRFWEADVTDSAAVQAAMQAVGSTWKSWQLIHNAALISYRRRDAAALQAVNVDGVHLVLTAARAAGAERCVHVSSVVAVGISPGGRAIDESFAFNAGDFPVDYVRTKRAGEERALAMAPTWDVRVVNPGAIFGPVQANSNSARFLQGIASGQIGRWAPPGGMAVVGVWDVARGIRLALERGRSGQRYILTESYLNSRQLFALVGQAILGADPGRGTLPRPLWHALRLAVQAVSWVREPVMTTPQAMRMLGVEFHQSAQRARQELGWQPEPFARVIERTVATLRDEGLLPG